MGRRVPILMYHSVSRLEPDPNMVCVSPERFTDHMRYLAQRGLRGVSVGELIGGQKTDGAANCVGLTFDDGYEDFLEVAVPVMEDFGFTATVFAVAGKSENEWEHAFEPRPRLKLLTAEQLRVVMHRGMEVGAHSVTHPKLEGLAPNVLDQEVRGSRELLGEILGEDVRGFCYPYGSLDASAVRAVRSAGYDYACAWNSRVEGNTYDLPRIPISNKDTPVRFAAKLRIYAHYSRLKKALPPSWVR